MIVGQRKPIPEILELVGPYRKVLNLGCGTCVAVCLVGGEKEAGILSAEIDMARKLAGNPLEIDTVTVLRQCDMEFLSELDERVEGYEALLSMACGAGVQFLAERFPSKPVLPMVNTTFIGVNRSLGIFEERCRACSECVLGLT
ncbi:MAG: methylenetetrahydrofolate reductase C-terminal domain-containing protein, partial [Polyangia bacterium]|nr:methylenetetrahydrofolate reductase C-terminal domain-containing protein [Polyangia bacterium]